MNGGYTPLSKDVFKVNLQVLGSAYLCQISNQRGKFKVYFHASSSAKRCGYPDVNSSSSTTRRRSRVALHNCLPVNIVPRLSGTSLRSDLNTVLVKVGRGVFAEESGEDGVLGGVEPAIRQI